MRSFRGHIKQMTYALSPAWLQALILDRELIWKVILELETEKAILLRQKVTKQGVAPRDFAVAIKKLFGEENEHVDCDIVPLIEDDTIWDGIFAELRCRNDNIQRKSIRIICDNRKESEYDELRKS